MKDSITFTDYEYRELLEQIANSLSESAAIRIRQLKKYTPLEQDIMLLNMNCEIKEAIQKVWASKKLQFPKEVVKTTEGKSRFQERLAEVLRGKSNGRAR